MKKINKKLLKVLSIIVINVIIITNLFNVIPAAANGFGENKVVAVSFKEGVSNYLQRKIIHRNNGKIKQFYNNSKTVIIKLPISKIENLQNELSVEWVEEENKGFKLFAQRQDWGIDKIKASDAWNSTNSSLPNGFKGQGIKVAVIDTGIDNSHPDFSGRITAGVSCVDYQNNGYTNNYFDKIGHGTHVAGIIAANDNSIGCIGVASQVQLYIAKVFDLNNIGQPIGGSDFDVAAAIRWAVENEVDIINMSLGSDMGSYNLYLACEEAVEAGILLVASAGNEALQGNMASFPAAYGIVIGVGATDQSNNRANFSNYGGYVDVVAPGDGIYSTFPSETCDNNHYDLADVAKGHINNDRGYHSMSGTSMAAPYVSGYLALLKNQFPNLTAAQLRQKMEGFALDLGDPGKDNYYGHGLVQFVAEGKTFTNNGATYTLLSNTNNTVAIGDGS